MISRATSQFWELYRALLPGVRAAAQKAYEKFSENPAHPSLRLERLRSWIGDHHEFDRRFPA